MVYVEEGEAGEKGELGSGGRQIVERLRDCPLQRKGIGYIPSAERKEARNSLERGLETNDRRVFEAAQLLLVFRSPATKTTRKSACKCWE